MRPVINIGKRQIGAGTPAYIIAEIGSNHDGGLEKAKELFRASKYAGADAVKIQSFTAEGLLNRLKPDENGRWVAHPAYPVIERLSVPDDWHFSLMEYSKSLGITFLSAPFDIERAELLERVGVEAYKIASGELTNEPLLKAVASFGKPVILSTGASYMDEVRKAVEVMESSGASEIALLQCASLYPPSYRDVNIRAMATLKDTFGCPVGFSDHTPGHTIPVAAIALGGSIIEKHITLDKDLKGPDHPYAMEVEEFKTMAEELRNLEEALGSGIKEPSEREMGERVGARRSIYARIDIEKGSLIDETMLKVVRHAYGLPPSDLKGLVGKTALRSLSRDMPVRSEDICR